MKNPIPNPDSGQDGTWTGALRPLQPALSPSTALQQRVARLAAATDRAASSPAGQAVGAPRRRLPLLLGTAAGVAALASVLTASIVVPRVALARTLHTVSHNLQQAEGIHYRISFFYRGKETLSQEIWQRGTRWRSDGQVDGHTLTEIAADGKFWFYDPVRHIATFQVSTSPSPIASNAQSFRTIQAHIQQALDSGKGENLGTVVRNNRRFPQVAVASPVVLTPFSPPVSGRLVFTIDPDRLLPALTQQQVRENGQWTTVSQSELDLDSRVSESVFTIADKNVRIYDLNAFGAQAGNRFAKPLASQRFGTRNIAIRDAQANRDGDLFILYTDGSTPRENRQAIPDDIHNDRNTEYTGTAGALQPFMYHQNPQLSRGMVVNGEVIQGLCLVPLVPRTPLPASALPRRVSITLRFDERKGKKTFYKSAPFTVPVRRTPTLLPSYAADLAILSLAGGFSEQFQQARESGRRMHYGNARDWDGMIRTTDRAIAHGVTDVNTYLNRAEAFDNLGQSVQARQALASARTLDTTGMYGAQITRAEEKLRQPKP